MESLVCIVPVFLLFPFICKGTVLGLTEKNGGCGLTLLATIATGAISVVLLPVVISLAQSLTRQVTPGIMPPKIAYQHPLGLLWWDLYIVIAIVAVISFGVDSIFLGYVNFHSLRRGIRVAALSNLIMAVTMTVTVAIGIEPALNPLS